MTLRWLVRPNTYHDSVKLMRLSEALSSQPGVLRAAAVMATPLNLELLAGDGLLPRAGTGEDLEPARAWNRRGLGTGEPAGRADDLTVGPDDLLVAVLAVSDDAARDALAQIDTLLAPREHAEASLALAPRTIEDAAGRTGAGLAVIAVPGPLAAAEAFAALRTGLHVFLFSDNVSLDDEVRLKALAARRDLLMMGPDCGTAIVNGIGLGFANRVEPGPVGIVGASGTGIQQVCCLLDSSGIGIAQAIGTGGRDLSAAVGGSMTRRALRLVEDDDDVHVILLISKPADAGVADALHRDLRASRKPVVACLLGSAREDEAAVRYARTLTDAAGMSAETLGAVLDPGDDAAPDLRRHAGFRSRVYGLFAGGTLAGEAGQVLDGMAVPHTLVDLGADRYTRGRAHPMIDPRFRASILPDVGRHGDAGALLLDVILGDLAHSDPAGALVPALEELRATTDLPVLAVLVGTRRDRQGLQRQRDILIRAGVDVFTSNARAAAAAGGLTGAPSAPVGEDL